MIRRDALRINLVATALLVVSGCRTLSGSGSDLDRALAELQRILSDLGTGTEKDARLMLIAQNVSTTANELVEGQGQFLISFDDLSHQAGTPEREIEALIRSYREERVTQRDELFRLQAALRAELTVVEWVRVVEVLNQKGNAMNPSTFQKG